MMERPYPYNQFRKDFDYFNQIAAKYDMGLRPNKLGYLEPYLNPNVA
jgi:hypothetical protein